MDVRAAVGVPEGAERIEVEGVRLAVDRRGRGPAVVCLSAVGHGGGDFEILARNLQDRFEVIRLDWPGHGRSDEDSQPLSPERYARLLAALLSRLGVERPILIGCSIGGASAILYARDHPVRALVLCDPGGLVEVDATVRWICRVFAAFFAAGERRAGWFRAAYALYYRWLVLPGAAARGQRRRIVAAGFKMAGKLREAWQGFGRPAADIRSVAWALDVPVWFAWSRDDRVIPLSLCRAAIARMRRASLSVFRGGHAAFLEQPEAFTEEFLLFVSGLESGVETGSAAMAVA